MLKSNAIDLLDERFKADSYAIYDQLRQQAPVCRVTMGRWLPAWLVTRYDDVSAALKDERLGKDPRRGKTYGGGGDGSWIFRALGPLSNHMLSRDNLDHSRLRALVQKVFTPQFVEGLRSRIESLSEELLDLVTHERMDIILHYALPLPVTVIAQMLGVPVADRKRFQRWSAALVEVTSPLQLVRVAPSAMAFLRYIRRLIKLRRKHPQNDLISSLTASEQAGDRLSEDELISMIFLLLLAGYETTVNLIGNGTLSLLENPAELARLRDQPALMPSAIEELLRYRSPLEMATPRWARCDLSIAGVNIRRGQLVVLGLAAANRDPAQFVLPGTLDLARQPNRHVAFGQGIHFCLGAPLARLEGQIAFAALLRRFPHLRLAVPHDALRWRNSPVLRGLQALPVLAS